MKKRLPLLDAGRTPAARLPARLLALLTLALLPIGLIAVFQTMAVVKEVERLGERDILVRTADAANAELSVIERAIGAAQALAATVATLDPSSAQCSTALKQFIARTPPYTLAVFAENDGIVRCSSREQLADLGESRILKDFFIAPGIKVDFTERGQISGVPVMVVLVPVMSDDGILGALSISIPHSLSRTLLSNQIEDVDIALLDTNGKIISASIGAERAGEFEQAALVPGEMPMGPLGTTRNIFLSSSQRKLFAVIPLIRGELYVVGQWADVQQPYQTTFFGPATPVFPILMWLASLFVAYLAIDRLVLKHLKTLRRRMARFSLDHPQRVEPDNSRAPAEVAEIIDSFNVMIDRIVQDHAELEDSVREKDILLKEVHHRVKNNLQLIASILNMQLRAIESEEARSILRRVQDRVVGLSLIHKLLYNDTRVDTVQADVLLADIIQSVLEIGSVSEMTANVDIDLDPVTLDPDNAVPLSLLVNEAVTNAVKYSGSDSGDSYIRILLKETEDHRVHLRVTNSCGAGQQADVSEGTGLGSRLIQAFVSQLEGRLDISETDAAYTIDVYFSKYELEGNDDDNATS